MYQYSDIPILLDNLYMLQESLLEEVHNKFYNKTAVVVVVVIVSYYCLIDRNR
jgi:cytochrome b